MNNKYDDVQLAQLFAANKGAASVRLSSSDLRTMAFTAMGWRGPAAKQLRSDLEHNNSGWCSVEVTQESYDNGPQFVLMDVEI